MTIGADAFSRLRALRAEDPVVVRDAVSARRRRSLWGRDGRLFIIAADHPARGALGVGEDAMAMADRYDLLERLAIALENPGVDGVLGTADIVDDLATLGLLDDKLVVGSINRGGLRGARFELDDRPTGHRIEAIADRGVDIVKALVRIDLDDEGTGRTLERTAREVDAAAEAGVPIMLEPFLSTRVGGRVVNELTAEATILATAIVQGLGSSSAYTWMKLPVVPDMERVMAATTLPTLLLGGDNGEEQDALYSSWERALALPGVRGLTVGRTLLYPPDGDVDAAIRTAAALVHPN